MAAAQARARPVAPFLRATRVQSAEVDLVLAAGKPVHVVWLAIVIAVSYDARDCELCARAGLSDAGLGFRSALNAWFMKME